MNIIIAITLVTTYTLCLCVANRHIPRSISQAVFALPALGSWLWTLVIGATAALSMPTLIDISTEGSRFLAFLACAGLLFVAFCPLDPKGRDMSYGVHMAGAYTCAVCSQLLVAVNQPWLLLLWIPWAFAFVWITKDERWLTAPFWAEVTCFATTFAYALIS